MLGLSTAQPPEQTQDKRIIPAERYGLKAISMPMLTGDDDPAILRGPMVGKYLKVFIDSYSAGNL
jgi:ATP-binding protein involved in chromosome partitioning